MKYIFEIRIKSGYTPKEYAAAWKDGSAIIQKESGAQGTKLYQKIGESNTLLAIATWESKAARDTAMKKLDVVNAEIRSVLDRHKEFADITKLGAFDETEWEVLP